MTNEELKRALLKKYPVINREIKYKCVSAIIYREKNGKIDISVELADYCGHSITIVNPREVTEAEG